MKTATFLRYLFCWLCPLFTAMAAISLDQDALVVDVSAQVRRVKVEKKSSGGKWELIALAHTDGRAGKVKIRLPASGLQLADLRVMTSEMDLLPFTSYLGKTEYRQEQDGAADEMVGEIDGIFTAVGKDGARGEELTVQESDIWKRDGSIFYFFNSVRGLQRIDASDPAKPVLTAQYSIPASGEQLYVLPGGQVVLLVYDNWGREGAVLLVDARNPSVLQPTHELPLRGYIRESRLVGSTLYVVCSASIWENENNLLHEYKSVTIVTRFDLSDPTQPEQTGEFVIDGYAQTATASPEHLLVATGKDHHPGFESSLVTVFALKDPSRELVPVATASTQGYIEDKFKLQVWGGILTTISYRWSGANRGTILENFLLQPPPSATPQQSKTTAAAAADPSAATPPPPSSTPPPTLPPSFIPPPPRPAPVLPEPFGVSKLAELPLAPGERLFATRLLGNTAYIVTFLIKDPLFVIDLSDPRNPKVTGQLDIPGYSTFLIPHNGRLLGVGIENWAVTVCLFDVSDPAKPSELRRLHMNAEGGHSWSEANYEDKAVSFLPEQNLLLLPVQGYEKISPDGFDQYRPFRAIQLITLLDHDGDGSIDDLLKEGQISHQVIPRRATTLDEKTVVSLSHREFLSIDVSDRRQPALLGDLCLSWPVAKVIQVGEHLIQFLGSGDDYGYWVSLAREDIGRSAKAIITPVAEPWKYSEIVDFGQGTLLGAQIDRDWLLVLTAENAAPQTGKTDSQPISTYRLASYALGHLPALTLLGESTLRETVSLREAGLLAAASAGDGNWLWYGRNLGYHLRSYHTVEEGARLTSWYGLADNSYLVSTRVDKEGRPQVLDVADVADYFTDIFMQSREPLPDGTYQEGTHVTSEYRIPVGTLQIVGNRAFFGRQTMTYQYELPTGRSIRNVAQFEVFPVDWADRESILIGRPVSVPGALAEAFPIEGSSDVVFVTQRNYLVREETVHYNNGQSYRQRVTAPLFEALLYDGYKAYLHSEYRYPEGTHVSAKTGGNPGIFVQSVRWNPNGASYTLDYLQWSLTDGLQLSGKLDFANDFHLHFFLDGYLVVTQDRALLLYQPQSDGTLLQVAKAEITGTYHYFSFDEHTGSWQLPVDAWIAQGDYGTLYVSLNLVEETGHFQVSNSRKLAQQATSRKGEQWILVEPGKYWLDACSNSEGVGKLVQRDWLFRPHDYRPLTTNAVDHGDTYMASAWFGEYLDLLYPWIGHRQHGWLLAFPDQANEAIFFWQNELGWMWTSAKVYPFLYSWSRGSWMFYWVGSGENGQPRYFCLLDANVWKWESIGSR